MSKEGCGAFYQFNRPAVNLTSLPTSALRGNKDDSVVARLIAVCFPLRLQYCFSDGLQGALFQLMDFMSVDESLVQKLLPQLISFIEDADAANLTWASACESGFAFNFVKKLLAISPRDDGDAIAGFLSHKITLLTDHILSGSGDVKTQAGYLRELFHSVAASPSIDWTDSQFVIPMTTKRILQFCTPFQEDAAISLAIKALLCCQTILDQILQPQRAFGRTETIRPGCEACFESAELVFSVAVDWNKSVLHKVAHQVALKSSVLIDGPYFIASCRYLSSFVMEYPIQPLRLAMLVFLQESSLMQHKTNSKALHPLTVSLTRQFGDLLVCFRAGLDKQEDSCAALNVMVVALTKLLTAMIQGESIFDTYQLIFSSSESDSTADDDADQTWKVCKETFESLAAVLLEEFGELKMDSYCFHFLKSLLHIVESAIDDHNSNISGLMKRTTPAQRQNTELALGFFCAIIRSCNDVDLINFGHAELLKLLQKKLPGRLLSLASVGLSELFAVGAEALAGDIHSRVMQLMAVLLKVEERVMFHARELIIQCQNEYVIQQQMDRQVLDLLDRARGVCAGFASIGKVMIQQSMEAEVNIKGSILVDRFLHVFTDLLPLIKKSDTLQLSRFIVDLSVLFLHPLGVILEGTLSIELNATSVEENFGRLSKFIRLWVGISMCAMMIGPEAEPEFNAIISHLARVSPPLIFGKLLGLSKSTDLGDELVMSDPLLERLIRSYMLSEDCVKPQSQFSSYEGLTSATLFLLNATHVLETSRVHTICDSRPLVGYFCDLHNWHSPIKRTAILQLAKNAEDLWMQSIAFQLAGCGHIPDTENDYDDDDGNGDDDNGADDDKNGAAVAWHWSLYHDLHYFLEDQVTFFIERCMDDRDDVRKYCSSLLVRMISELPWMLRNPGDLIAFCLDSLTLLEQAMHVASSYNLHEPSYPSGDYFDEQRHRQQEQQELEEGEGKEAMEQNDTKKMENINFHPENSFVKLLQFRRILPALSFPQREDRTAAVSIELLTVIYTWLSSPLLSQVLKESILQNYISKHGSTAGRLTLSVAAEMLASPRPIYHGHRMETFSASSSAISSISPSPPPSSLQFPSSSSSSLPFSAAFDKPRAYAAHHVAGVLEKQKHQTKFAHWAIKDSIIKRDANDLQASKAALDSLTNDLAKVAEPNGMLDLIVENQAHLSSSVANPKNAFYDLLQKILNRLDGIRMNLPLERSQNMLMIIRELDALLRLFFSRVKAQPGNLSAFDVSSIVCNIVEALCNIFFTCRLSDDVGSAVLQALEHAFAIFPQHQAQMIAIITPAILHVCTSSFYAHQNFPSTMQYLLRFTAITALGRSTVGYLATRSLTEAVLTQVALSAKEIQIAEKPGQLLMFLGLQSLEMFHSQRISLPVACNRILRENIFLALTLMATRHATDSVMKEQLCATAFVRTRGAREWSDEMQACSNWCKLLYLVLEDQQRWLVDYECKLGTKLIKASSASSVLSLVTNGNEAEGEAGRAVYFGAEAAFDHIIARICKFRPAYRKLQPLPAFSAGFIHQPVVLDALQRQRIFGLGILSVSSKLVAGNTEVILSSSGMISAIYMLLIRRIDFLSARSISTYGTTMLDSPQALEVAEVIRELKKLVDFSLAQSIKVYKFSVKALWIVSPSLALSLKQLFADLSLKDGKRKGISHLALFLSRHLAHSATLRDFRFLPLLLDIYFHNNSSVMDKAICLNAMDMLDDAPLYCVVQMLSRCDAHHQEAWNGKNQHSIAHLVRYIHRVLSHADSEVIIFYLPQLVQLLRRDVFGALSTFLMQVAATSPTICHQLVWLLQTECKSSRDDKNEKLLMKLKTNTARHGFCGQLSGLDSLPMISRRLIESIMASLPDQDYRYLQDEMSLFNFITDISSKLKNIPSKEAHSAFVKEVLEHITIPDGAYMPTNPYRRVVSIQLDSARPMQSAAKCPYLLKFQTVRWKGPDAYIRFIVQRRTSSSISERDEDGNDIIMEEEPKLILRTRTKTKASTGASGIGKKAGSFTAPRYGAMLENNSAELDRPSTRSPERSPRRVTTSGSMQPPSKSSYRSPRRSPLPSLPSRAWKEDHYEEQQQEEDRSRGHDTEDACIFKTFDDCRQDLITLQVIRLLKNWFQHRHLPVYVVPYQVICNRTGETDNVGGILEVVKHVSSRDQLGKAGAKTLMQHFVTSFGQPGSERFHSAQLAFARSLAPYAVICHILHIKDRHNGNIMIDRDGHIVHIDFGFILGISPGHNMGFEAAPFKLSPEMVDVMGGKNSEVFKQFTVLAIQCFLAAREVMEPILAMVCAFADSDLPCFQYKAEVLARLQAKFMPQLTEEQAGQHMAQLVWRAMSDWTASAYDGVQKLQNNIYSAEWK